MRISYDQIMRAAQWWADSGGLMEVDVAALEPLLWKDNDYRIHDVVYALKKIGFVVKMTSNGSLLKNFAVPLSESGLDLLRLSWHSCEDRLYREITGGGSLLQFIAGLNAALDSSLNVSINRVLLRGYTNDLAEQIDFVDVRQIRLKVLDLYWTEESNNEYDRFYISPQTALAPYLEAGKLHEVQGGGYRGFRDRMVYSTSNGGTVEYKVAVSAKKDDIHCQSCSKQRSCLEGYADYFRLFPDGSAAFCYLRHDLAFNVFEDDQFTLNRLSPAFRTHVSYYFGKTPLRLVVEGRCNFNCGFPGSKKSWCLKQGRGYAFPKRVLNYDVA